jgi:hypothetical protein
VSDAKTIAVTIRIAKDAEGRLDAVVTALKAAGLSNAEVRTRFLMVQGDVSAAGRAALEAVDGVLSVQADRSYKTQGG